MDYDPDTPVYRRRNYLSGRYKRYPIGTNENVFRKEDPTPNLIGENFFLVYGNGFWFITNEKYVMDKQIVGGFLRLKASGTSNKMYLDSRLKQLCLFSVEPVTLEYTLGRTWRWRSITWSGCSSSTGLSKKDFDTWFSSKLFQISV